MVSLLHEELPKRVPCSISRFPKEIYLPSLEALVADINITWPHIQVDTLLETYRHEKSLWSLTGVIDGYLLYERISPILFLFHPEFAKVVLVQDPKAFALFHLVICVITAKGPFSSVPVNNLPKMPVGLLRFVGYHDSHQFENLIRV